MRAGPELSCDGRGAILKESPDDLARGRQLHRREEAGQHRIDVRSSHRELGGPQVVHRVAERVDALAVDVRDGAGAAELQIAVEEHHADRVARFRRAVVRHFSRSRPRRRAAHREKALLAKCAAERIRELGFESRHHERCGNRAEQRAELIAPEAADAAGSVPQRRAKDVHAGAGGGELAVTTITGWPATIGHSNAF